MTKLSAALADFALFQVQVSSVYATVDWKDDLRKLMTMAGIEGKEVVFLFSDTQIKFESMLEDINNILNNGEVPGLMGPEELPMIIETISPIAKKVLLLRSGAKYCYATHECDGRTTRV